MTWKKYKRQLTDCIHIENNRKKKGLSMNGREISFFPNNFPSPIDFTSKIHKVKSKELNID